MAPTEENADERPDEREHATPNFSRPLRRQGYHDQAPPQFGYAAPLPTQRASESSNRSPSHTRPGRLLDTQTPSGIASQAPKGRQSINFAPVVYTATTDEQRLRQKRWSLPQAPDATPLSSAGPSLHGARVGSRQYDRTRSAALRPLSWTPAPSWTRPSSLAERRRSIHVSDNSRPQSLSDEDYGDRAYIDTEKSRFGSVYGIGLEIAGVDQRDFAPLHSDRVRSSSADNPKHWYRGLNTRVTRRANSWAPGMHVERRRSSRLSLPGNLRRRASHSFETIFGSDRKPSILARVTEGVLAPTAEEIATQYSTPSVAAFNLDLEKGPAEPDGPVNPARSLTKRELLLQRLFFASLVVGFNAACIIASATGNSGAWVLAVILFFKSKDFISVWIQVFCISYARIKRIWTPIEAPTKAAWILSLIPAYSETEEQIVKALFSLRDNGTGEHRQVMCIVLDGKHRPIKSHMTKVVASFTRKYVSLKWKIATLQIDAGFVDDIPTLCIEKIPNAGKKDSLVLCHDLFNFPRANMDESVRSLREELSTNVLPQLTGIDNFPGFDLVFCTDADSTIHKGALASLANACLADPKAIAACGFVFVEYEPGLEWSVWNLYQQFQYSFGQIVRRGAEHFIGKVTCLPGCITMIVVREEMAGAIEKYAKPVTSFPVLRHQVQYLGTDRRLTYAMLSQAPYLHTLFVPEAGSETVAPQSLKHYLSQRRRWGSNAYGNNYFYFAGQNMIIATRVGAAIEILRLSMVYFRVFNTVLFIKGVITHFDIIQLLPLIFISFTPSFWFAFAVMFMNKHLRDNWIKLTCGFCINRCISPFMSVTVFSLVVKNLGSQVWGISGVTAGAPVTAAAAIQTITEQAAAEVEAQENEKTIL